MSLRRRIRVTVVGVALSALPACMQTRAISQAPPEKRDEVKARATMPPPDTRPVDVFNALKPYKPDSAPMLLPVSITVPGEPEGPELVPTAGRIDPPIVETLRAFAENQPEQAHLFLQRFERPNQELLAALLPLAVKIGDANLRQPDAHEFAAIVGQLNAIVAQLRDKAALQIPNACFCRPATSARFGAFQPLDAGTTFKPAEMVAVYLELRNFACPRVDGEYRTHVGVSVEILDAAGQVALRFDRSQVDPTLSPRQDYCNIVRFALPALPPGAYTLALQATDVPTGRVARRTLEFRVKPKDEGGGS